MASIAIPAVETSDLAGAGSESVVAAQDLTRCYGEGDTAVKALRGVSLDVAEGQLTAVMGPSGSGKSTLMHILAGLDKATSGEVTIAGTAISELNDTELTHLRRQHIGFIFQFFNLLPMLNAEENVVLPLSLAGEKPDKEWVAELMRKIGLEQRREPSSVGALGWTAAARCDRPRARQPSDDRLRGRADRQPRLQDEQRDPGAHARLGRRLRPDDRDGHPRSARRDDRGPDPLPGGRPDRPRPRRVDRSEVIAVSEELAR